MLELTGITKKFNSFLALEKVDFNLEAGEVHALLGENGAGKSTLINVLAGIFPQTGGAIRLDGKDVAHLTPQKAQALGIAAVFQEFSLAPDLTVLENLFLGKERRSAFLLDKRAMRAEAGRLLAELNFPLPLDEPVAFLSRGQKQMVEIAKALRTQPRVLILDEPTASLTNEEAERLFAAMAAMKARGVGILYVSHRMNEIRALADRITVLRGGRRIGTVRTDAVSDDALIEMMVGRPVEQLFPKIRHAPGEVRLSVENLTTRDGTVLDASIVARAGEVVGLAGLVGCGRSELCRAVFGLDPVAAGTVSLAGRPVAHPTPAAMLARDVCYFPADRGAEGLALIRTARENVTMAVMDLPGLSKGQVLKVWREAEAIRRPLEDIALKPMAPERKAGAFSGGNQQKIMLARGLMKPFDVYLFDEPTVGIDVGAKADIYNLIRDLVENGACVVLSTSELPELTNLAARVYVLYEGRVTAELSGGDCTEEGILSHYFGEIAERSEA